jgi:hypothetical protein
MIFLPEHCELIKSGDKTHTRRLKLPHHHFAAAQKIGMNELQDRVYERLARHHSRLKWEVGRDYAVCPGRGKHQVARIKLLGIRSERIQDISHEDIGAEGITHVWPVMLNTAYLITGAKNEDELKRHLFKAEFAGLWDGINKKAGSFWSDNPEVWVLEFELAR